MQPLKDRGEQGVSAILVAVSLLFLLGVAALAIDIGFARTQRLNLQNASDSAALAGSFDIPDDATLARATAAEYGYRSVNATAPSGVACGADTECFDMGDFTLRVTTPYSKPGSTVPPDQLIRVQMCSASPTFFGRVLGSNSIDVCGDAVASSTPGKPDCVLCILSPTGTSFRSTGDGAVNVSGGDVVVNSGDDDAVTLSGNGNVTTTDGDFGVVGGYSAPSGAFSPEPTSHGGVEDPFDTLPVPSLSGSPAPQVKLSGSADVTLSPGIYSEIISSSSGQITLQPGIYVITQGIRLSKSPTLPKASVLAHGVMIYFACENYPTPCAPGQKGATLTMSGGTTIDWTPPTSGPYEGISIFYDRNNTATLTMTGQSENAFAGAVYARSGTLSLTGTSGASTTMESMLVVGNLEKTGDSEIDIVYDNEKRPPALGDGVRRLVG